ncbi:MAG: YpdA family putative bacillithiol disulfide reductase [Gemmatimonadota bacterium]
MRAVHAGQFDVAVVGAGPCGLAAAISLDAAGKSTVILDAGCVVNAITQYPTYATFFSTAEKLSLGGLPFIIPGSKPERREALAYYRAVVAHFGLDVRQYERVTRVEPRDGGFLVHSLRRGVPRTVSARNVVIATGYWGSPNMLGIPGEDLPHVSHSYREGHFAFQQRTVVVGGGNSAAEAALELWRSGANVTLVHFGPTFDKKIKPWVLPDLNNRLLEGSITARWNCRATLIDADCVEVRTTDGAIERIPADLAFLLTGFAPDVSLLAALGVPIDPVTGIPAHNPDTLESTVNGIFIAGVVVAGFDANRIFIENGRFHGERIAAALRGLPAPSTPGVSRDLDGG